MDRIGPADFRYVATDGLRVGLRAERRRMGWNDAVEESWILRAGEHRGDREKFEKWWLQADVVLTGQRDVGMLSERLQTAGLTFHMSERFWKPPLGRARLLHPRFLIMAIQYRRLARTEAFNFLAIGPHSERDLKQLARCGGGVWSWGYFPPGSLHPEARIHRRDGLHVMWAGRMLPWKRVRTLIRAFGELRRDVPNAFLTLIGNGPERAGLESLVAELKLGSCVSFRGSMKAELVREEMRDADVFVLSSSGQEGWGAVVNEAMGEGCVVVATAEAGSAGALIDDGVNGYLYRGEDVTTLSGILKALANDPVKRQAIALRGKSYVDGEWSPRTAADRFLAVADAKLRAVEPPAYKSGPMVWLPQ